MPVTLKFKRLHPAAKLPTKAHPVDAGWDLYAPGPGVVTLPPGVPVRVPLGLAWECPPGWYAQLAGRSGLAAVGVAVLGGVVDCGFRGEWAAVLCNAGRGRVAFAPGERLCQFVLIGVPETTVIEVDGLAASERGSGGFGSTGA
jgi:dUTP pyrophosphatase